MIQFVLKSKKSLGAEFSEIACRKIWKTHLLVLQQGLEDY